MTRFDRPTGPVSARVHGGRIALCKWADAARSAAAQEELDERAAAALRGKATAYLEAATVLAAIEYGTSSPKRAEESA